MAIIHVLDTVTANQIAAGEVVERPVNAVKELVENAVDAGAREIEIEIADGGMSYIRVTDDGCGMSPEDAKLSVIRHATSKISTVENIYHIVSLGFRGEALPSIMAVSRSSITTRRPEDTEGTVLEITGGKMTEVRSAGAPAGTTVEVRDLFFNVPARKKFLKSERTESSRINSMVGKLSLANPDIAFRLINNGRTVTETPGNGRLLDAVTALYGMKIAKEMLEVQGEGENAFMTGLISKPSLLKSSRQYQTIIVNRRVVENAMVTKAVDNAYHSLLPKNGYPLLVLQFQVPPESIDVNVHPQKREIKFSDEQTLFRLVYHSVLETLTGQSTADAIAREMTRNPGHEIWEGQKSGDLKVESNPQEEENPLGGTWGLPALSSPDHPGEEIPEREEVSAYPTATESFKHRENPQYREIQTVSGGGASREEEYHPAADRKVLFSEKSVLHPSDGNQSEKEAELLFKQPERETIPVIPLGQVSDCFILCSCGKDLFIIDQHAAHERVRYDRMAAAAEGIPVQEILVPYLIHADPEDIALMEEKKKEIARLGLTFEQAGADVIRVTGAPGDFSASETERVVNDLLKAYHDFDQPSPETLRHRMMAYAACRGAIKRGDPLNIRQMRELISDLFSTTRPFVCPHGRPTIVKFTPSELGHLFKRP